MKKPEKKYYQINWKKSAVKSIKKLPEQVKRNMLRKIEELFVKPQKGELLKGDVENLRRIRVGDYRVIYWVNKEKREILIVKIGRRDDIYKKI